MPNKGKTSEGKKVLQELFRLKKEFTAEAQRSPDSDAVLSLMKKEDKKMYPELSLALFWEQVTTQMDSFINIVEQVDHSLNYERKKQKSNKMK